jgi:hypothetical protein
MSAEFDGFTAIARNRGFRVVGGVMNEPPLAGEYFQISAAEVANKTPSLEMLALKDSIGLEEMRFHVAPASGDVKIPAPWTLAYNLWHQMYPEDALSSHTTQGTPIPYVPLLDGVRERSGDHVPAANFHKPCNLEPK